MRLTRGIKRALSRLLKEKQGLVEAIHPILSDDTHPIGHQCEKVCRAASLLEDAIHEALLVITSSQIRTVLHRSEAAVVCIRNDVSRWKEGGVFPVNMKSLLAQILPAEILQADEFLEISEAEVFDDHHELVADVEAEAHSRINNNPFQEDGIGAGHDDLFGLPENEGSLQDFHRSNIPHSEDNGARIYPQSTAGHSCAASTTSSRSSRSTIRQSPRNACRSYQRS